MKPKLTDLDAVQSASVVAQAIVQTGLIDSGEMDLALKTWKEAGQGISFSEFVVERGWLVPDEVNAVITIVESQLARKQGAGFQPESRSDHDTGKHLTTAIQSEKDQHEAAAQSIAPVPGLQLGVEGEARFRIVSEHRHGGLGEVFVAEDTQFGRQVALKRIKPQFSDRPQLCNRFLVEAELTGGLEHPGIVPVYGLGRSGDGIPFYAMKFVQGQSLGDALKAFHADPNKSFGSVEFRKLLRRFASVCYTIHFSHSRGVIHRDIKPDNIMLGDYDETLVVDWGIAKVKDSHQSDERTYKPEVAESTFQSHIGSGSRTQLGKIIGSLGYMSSEQALGWHDSLGPESDVFSLGATLYSILVPAIPFDGANTDQILQNTIAGELVAPRQIDSAVPKPLEAICLKAMQNVKSKRYSTALALAEDIETYLSDEPVTAWSEPLSIRVRRWIKKNQKAVLTGVAALVLLTVGAIAMSTLLAAANSRESRARQQATGNFMIAKNVVDDFLKQLAIDPRLESASMAGLTQEMLGKAETLQLQLQQKNEQGLSFEADRADTAYLIAAVASKLGQNEKAINYLEQARDLVAPHLNDPDSGEKNRSLMLSVLLDLSKALTKTGGVEDASVAIESGLAMVDQQLERQIDVPHALAQKTRLLLQSEIIFHNMGKMDERDKTRDQFWLTVQQFLKHRSEASIEDRLEMDTSVLNISTLTEQESSKYQSLRLESIKRLETTLGEIDDSSIVFRKIKADNTLAVANAYAQLDEKKKSYELAFSAAQQWFDLASDNPTVMSFKKYYLSSMYTAIISRADDEVLNPDDYDDESKTLGIDFIQNAFFRSAGMYQPFAADNTVKDIETDIIFTHLLCKFASYLMRHETGQGLIEGMLLEATRLQEGFPESGYSNANLVRNESLRLLAIHYATTNRPALAKSIRDKQVLELRNSIQANPMDFVLHRQLYDLHISNTVLLDPFGGNSDALQSAISQCQLAIEDVDSMPEALRQANEQRVLGMRSRIVTMLADLYEAAGDNVRRDQTIEDGLKACMKHDVDISMEVASLWVVPLCVLSIDRGFELEDYPLARKTLDFMLNRVTLTDQEKAKAYLQRATCAAELGAIEDSFRDFRSAVELRKVAGFSLEMEMVKSALSIADKLDEDAVQQEIEAEQQFIDFLDQSATESLVEKLSAGVFEFELSRSFLRDFEPLQRLAEVPELKELFTLLPKEGKDHLQEGKTDDVSD